MNSGGRLEWIDVLKCLGMLLVVVGHASHGGTPDTYRYYIYSFHMPLFFIISGMTFYLQCQKRSFDFVSLVKNKAKGLVWPYFVLSFLTVPISLMCILAGWLFIKHLDFFIKLLVG